MPQIDINQDGTVQFADHILLDDKMRAGFARGFSTQLPHNIKFAADVAIRRSEEVNELDRAIFTPCDVCAEERLTQVSDLVDPGFQGDRGPCPAPGLLPQRGDRGEGRPDLLRAGVLAPRSGINPRLGPADAVGGSLQETRILLSAGLLLGDFPVAGSLRLPRDQCQGRAVPEPGIPPAFLFRRARPARRPATPTNADFRRQRKNAVRRPDLTRPTSSPTGAFDLDKDWSWGFPADRTSGPISI